MNATSKELLADHRALESEFQIDHFVIGRAGDDWGKYQQALRQIDTLESAIVEDRLIIAELKHEILIANPERSALEKARTTANVERLARAERVIVEKIRNLEHLKSIAVKLQDSIGDLDEPRRYELERALWEHRLKMRAAIDVLLGGNVSRETLELMISCPIDMRARLVGMLDRPHELRAFAINHDADKLLEVEP